MQEKPKLTMSTTNEHDQCNCQAELEQLRSRISAIEQRERVVVQRATATPGPLSEFLSMLVVLGLLLAVFVVFVKVSLMIMEMVQMETLTNDYGPK
ncbi:hypothetical protein BDD12DRAFT_910632 [Trichophaea hybrida]|nr:hypothetical protein BDD12DRAFT_910632 [Trichophaea hybrida]